MIDAVRNYFGELSTVVGAGWNRFWFTPAPARALGAMRVVVGLLALYSVATYGPDLQRWFGREGMLPLPMIRQLYDSQWSVLDYVPPHLLQSAYWASLGVLGLYVAGVGGRVTAVLATVATLSFFSRAPLLTGEFEAIISFLLVYLCIGRASDEFSVPALLRRRRASGSTIVAASPANAISLRLLQVHLAMAHLMMGWAQLAAPEAAWWSGEGVWLAAMRTDMSLVNLDFLTNHPRVVAAWSHLMTLYLVAFPVFVWVRWTRPLVLAVGVAVWGAFALASGWVLFCLAMLAGLIAFLERPAA